MTQNQIGTQTRATWMDMPGLQGVLQALGYPEIDVRFVGGCVRDTILGRPVSDIDIATPDLPQKVMKKVTTAGLGAIPTGLAHGTVTITSEGRGFEVTTLRRDTSCDGRHAEVEFTTDWREDASRRDFTINAMSARPDGTLFDPFGGVEDCNVGRVRFVGDPTDRIKEDYLRILRYFRFLAHYGTQVPDETTLSVCAELRNGLDTLSEERVRDELIKLLAAPNPAPSVSDMAKAGILDKVFPEHSVSSSLASLIIREQDVEAPLVSTDWQRRLVFLLTGAENNVKKVTERLRLSNKDKKAIDLMVRAVAEAPHYLAESERKKFLYAHQGAVVSDAILIAWAQNKPGDDEVWRNFHHTAKGWAPINFPLRGADATVLGVPQGPKIGRLLEELEKEWIESGFMLSHADLRNRLTTRLVEK